MLYLGAIILISAYLFLAYLGFRRAWGEFRLLQRERVTRALGLMSPALQSARHDPFVHLPHGFRPDGLRFIPEKSRSAESDQRDPLMKAILDWERHHHEISHGFLTALSHIAHDKLIPSHRIQDTIEPIGESLSRLIEDCPNESFRKELRIAYAGLRTGAEQNLDYAARRLQDTVSTTKTAFQTSLGGVQLLLGRCREELIHSICVEADREIESFLNAHRGFLLNPLEWGRQAAYYREFEALRERLMEAKATGDLGQVTLLVVMIVQDEKSFVDHLHSASRRREELHRQASKELETSTRKIHVEADHLSTWVIEENRRLQSAVSHQLLLHIERSETVRADHRMSNWIQELVRLRDQSIEMGASAA